MTSLETISKPAEPTQPLAPKVAPNVRYVSRAIGEANGADIAGLNVVHFLATSDKRLTVLTPSPKSVKCIQSMTGLARKDFRHITLPPDPESPPRKKDLSFYRKVLRAILRPRLLLSEIEKRVGIFQHRQSLKKGQTAAPIRGTFETLIVNGMGSHSVARIARDKTHGVHAIVVQESPKHFENHLRGLTEDWAVDLLSQYDALIFASSNCMDRWLEHSELADKKAFYLPNTIREEEVKKVRKLDRRMLRRKLAFADDQYVVICPASVQYRKGQDLLIDQMPDLLLAIPNLQVILVGPDHWDWSANQRRRIKQLGLSDSIKMIGTRSTVLDMIYAADAVVLPTRAEAMPLVILEAMALETPVVASDVDGIPEMITSGENGYLFSHDNIREMVTGLSRLAADPELAATFAKRASNRYWSDFSISAHSQRLAAIMEEIDQLPPRISESPEQ